MTPEEFFVKMKNLSDDEEYDTEYRHKAMDRLMCEVLIELGYIDGIRIFDYTPKWYA